MSAAVLARDAARLPARPSWWQSIGAALGGTPFAFVFSLVWIIPLSLLRVLPFPEQEDLSGHGWPWRIDGP